MKLNYVIIIILFIKILCLFDEEIEMERSIEGNGLFLEKFDDNNVYISNSFTNYIFNGMGQKHILMELFHYLHQYMNLL